METNRTLSLKSKASVKTKPDTIEVHMTLSAKKTKYHEAMTTLDRYVRQLFDALKQADFDKKDCKTASFDIDAVYEYYYDKNDNRKSRFTGYRAQQKLILRFDMDTSRLSKAMTAVARSEADPQISIRFTVKDPTDINNRLLAEATKNAFARAEILAGNAGATLGKLLRIDYNWIDINITSSTNLDESLYNFSCSCEIFENIDPEDITAEDSVFFIWELL